MFNFCVNVSSFDVIISHCDKTGFCVTYGEEKFEKLKMCIYESIIEIEVVGEFSRR